MPGGFAKYGAPSLTETAASIGGPFQPLDSDLTAIAVLTTTSYGRGLLTSASQAALGALLAADSSFTGVFAPLPTPLVTGRYYRVPNGTLSTSATLANGTVRVSRKFIPGSVTIDRIGSEVTSIGDVGSHFRIGIWSDTNGRPDVLVLDAGQIDGHLATVQEITVNQALTRGWYWFGGAVQDVTVTQPTMRTVGTPIEPTVMDLGTTTPSAGLSSVSAQYSGATAAFGNFGTYATGGAAASIFVRTA